MTTITDLGPPTQLVEGRAPCHLRPSRDVTSIDSLVAIGSGRPSTVSCHDIPRSATSRRRAGEPVPARPST